MFLFSPSRAGSKTTPLYEKFSTADVSRCQLGVEFDVLDVLVPRARLAGRPVSGMALPRGGRRRVDDSEAGGRVARFFNALALATKV